MNPNLTEDSLDRLAIALMTKHSVGYAAARRMLGSLRLNLVCHPCIADSPSLQAALLTAVNSGKRAFHGGVFVTLPDNIACLLPWPGNRSLGEIVFTLGGQLRPVEDSPLTQTLYFGPAAKPVAEGFNIVCDGWRGGIVRPGNEVELLGQNDFALGGILAGALGVARGFLRVAGLSVREIQHHQGYSLWRPDLDWTSADAGGPPLEVLPKSLWMLGLGHLGQGYLWSFSLLPYENPKEVTFLLQDFDSAVEANYSSGLLCEHGNIGTKKARICAEWLEERSFSTNITERAFDSNAKRTRNDPFIACCGFDSADARRDLDGIGCDLVVECGLGADAARFDRMTLHTFPDASRKPSEVWETVAHRVADQRLVDAFRIKGDCGILAETLARKAVSTSFVGAFAGSLVSGEILRALHGGFRAELLQVHLRHNELPGVIFKQEQYMNRVARSGFCSARSARKLAA